MFGNCILVYIWEVYIGAWNIINGFLKCLMIESSYVSHNFLIDFLSLLRYHVICLPVHKDSKSYIIHFIVKLEYSLED